MQDIAKYRTYSRSKPELPADKPKAVKKVTKKKATRKKAAKK